MITLPPPTWPERVLHGGFRRVLWVMRRVDRLGFRQVFNPLLREPIAHVVQWLMGLRRRTLRRLDTSPPYK